MEKKQTHKLAWFLTVFALAACVFPVSGQAEVPRKISYQGFLTQASGAPIDGTVNLTLAIFDTASGGTPLWTENQNSVPVVNGIYSVVLGSFNPIDLPFDAQYYLGIAINGEELAPRKAIGGVGYALRAYTVDVLPSHTHSAADISSGVIPESQIDPAMASEAEVAAAVGAHGSRADNPHAVTAGQVGAAPALHDHDPLYLKPGQAASIGTEMIQTGAVTDSKISGPISAGKISSSGLDADLLDGLHASAFAPASHEHDSAYVNSTGDAMTGPLAVSVSGGGNALSGASSGTGSAVSGLNQGTGNAGYFEIANAESASAALYAATNGAGPAGHFTGGVYASGNLGLGISNPAEKLEIAGNAKINGTVNSQAYNAMPSATHGNDVSLRAGKAGGGFDHSLNFAGGGWNGGNLNLSAGGANHFGRGGTVTLNAGDTFDTGSVGGNILLKAGGYSNWTPGYIGFFTGGSYPMNLGAPLERMRVAGNGNVGIGTQNPQSPLQVTGYIQIATSAGEPPSADCDEANERGRMRVDSANGLLYVCVDAGWIAK